MDYRNRPIQESREEMARWQAQIPPGWTPEIDPSINQNDIDGNIRALQEKIQEGVCPELFERRLRPYIEEKQRQEEMARNEPEGLGTKVYQRLDSLKKTYRYFEEISANHPQLKNLRAVLEAYRSKKLEVRPNMMTYWAEGVQLCNYRPWDWDEFGEFADTHGAEEQKLWPEQPREQPAYQQMSFRQVPPDASEMYSVP